MSRRFILIIQSEASEVPTIIRLRRLLKIILRRLHFRLVDLTEHTEEDAKR